jgi:hypothetical protein
MIWLAWAVVGVLPAEVRFEARHKHFNGSCTGVLAVDEQGISFKGPKKHGWTWKYHEIQELKLAPNSIRVLTYQDRRMHLGADAAYEFQGTVPGELYAIWRERLDQRFVAELADAQVKPQWRIPAKHLTRLSGAHGILEVGPDRIVFATDRRDESRTWRFSDIDNISRSGPFQLTITTFERARFHYGDRKGFNFELKQALSEARYDELWRTIQRENGTIQRP